MEIKYALDEINQVARMIVSILNGKRTILLRGELGAGKTHLSAEIIRCLFVKMDLVVRSPTYSIVNIYRSDGYDIAHLDLYRVKSTEELYELGLQEILKNYFCLIEWPEVMKNSFINASEVLHITIAVIGDDKRILHLN
ncbi:tRNA (adenosine(37)-N6)-threonylcarbamoyltransferase complex ATPase subunit type 1 TsaE [Neorickettsia findlayensis]|uniref:tRNA threonylcarbamoyladenosine biosynthesis protein TsaE n=1 Tax=Neorickettsia findlayensis TaxID=2686014 RepID=A0A6P1GA66_9RICK|nr:tRNA (adenosine(37)-N6)-threonylcarbamoyltransferase complex ATPase subunit type 1 TsaE [Neorickettsia findlayensis]QHD65367.1 tRNA (adenosine(37)-N6)-threonylcarbamoyltransferase complex ATPase subunit type 1 TsaE [Neorickettsia findlayensis]